MNFYSALIMAISKRQIKCRVEEIKMTSTIFKIFKIQKVSVEYDSEIISKFINDVFELDGQKCDIEFRSFASNVKRQNE